ncbi:hypothetical protein PR003_g25119 [Phytophthora rubi]|uniref:Uncharacterized protein n=1 Tax=Phytophthora rubi TaxID=129364 RepID=A0A6A4CS78_9STRA|nr:hypothetical protein PR002_g24262 [Phytophthora rubi]KAE9291128.1 hypothetical protein PR003_g25119 [Phytophthora rubi]
MEVQEPPVLGETIQLPPVLSEEITGPFVQGETNSVVRGGQVAARAGRGDR